MRRASPCLILAVAACSPTRTVVTDSPVFDAMSTSDVATDNVPDARFRFDASADAARDVTMLTHDTGVDAAADASNARTDATDAQVVQGLCPSGTGTFALVGGSSTEAFAAVSTNGSAFVLTTFPGLTMSAAPALLALGATSFVGVFPSGPSDDLMSTIYAPASGWSLPSPIVAMGGGDAAATTKGAPSLGLLGTNAELVDYGPSSFFYHAVYSAGAWGPASDVVGGTASQDFGPSQPAAAVAGSTLWVAFDGSNNGLYVDSWTVSGGWTGAQGINGAGVGEVPPTLVGLTGGAADGMLVFEQETTTFLYSVLHTPGSGWGAPVQLGSTALATTPVSLAPLANGGVAMVYEGTNGLAYGAVYSATASPPWSPPVEIGPSGTTLSSPPSITVGACGYDAIAALAAAGGATLVGLTAGAWGASLAVTVPTETTFVSVVVPM